VTILRIIHNDGPSKSKDRHAWPAEFGSVRRCETVISSLFHAPNTKCHLQCVRLTEGEKLRGYNESTGKAAANLLAALAIGVLQLGVAISLATLIFTGPLADGAGRAAASFLLGTAVVSGLVGLSSKMSIVISGAQDTAAIVAAAVAASIASSPKLGADEAVPTVVVMIALSTLLTGLAFWTIGKRGLSDFVRYLPFPVISGFTVGTGWLLFRGGIEVMRGSPIEFQSIGELFGWSEFKFLLPGLALVAVMIVVVRGPLPNTLVSVAILSGAVIFHLVGRSLSSASALENGGWLIGPFEAESGWTPIQPSDLTATNWGVMFNNALPIVAIVAVSVIGLLLNLSGLENGPDLEIDLNNEIRTAGVANLLTSATGALVGYHLIGDTVLARQIGARGRVVPLTIAGLAIGIFLLGSDLIALMPRAIAGGVLAGLGVTLLISWVTTSLPRMQVTDRMLSALILAIIALLGVLEGVSVGVLVAAVLFIVNYGRTNPVRYTIDAAGRSNVDRSPGERQILSQAAGSILAFELQGYLFFGSTTKLLADVRRQVGDSGGIEQCEYIIVDFARVTGIDSTATTGFATFSRQLDGDGPQIVWTGLKPEIHDALAREFDISAHRDLDHAISWCEDQLLATRSAHDVAGPSESLLTPELQFVMPKREVRAGETLIAMTDTDRHVYFVMTGKLTAWIKNDEGQLIRIRQVLPGAALGEIAFCTGAARTATVVADTDATLLVMSRQSFDALVLENPQAAIAFQEALLSRLGQRVSSTSALVRDLLH